MFALSLMNPVCWLKLEIKSCHIHKISYNQTLVGNENLDKLFNSNRLQVGVCILGMYLVSSTPLARFMNVSIPDYSSIVLTHIYWKKIFAFREEEKSQKSWSSQQKTSYDKVLKAVSWDWKLNALLEVVKYWKLIIFKGGWGKLSTILYISSANRLSITDSIHRQKGTNRLWEAEREKTVAFWFFFFNVSWS